MITYCKVIRSLGQSNRDG